MSKKDYYKKTICEIGKNEVYKYMPILDTISQIGNYKNLLHPNTLEELNFEIEQRLSKIPTNTLNIPNAIRLKTIFDDLILSVTDEQLRAIYTEMLVIEFTKEQEKNSLYLHCLKYLTNADIKVLKKYFDILTRYEKISSLPMLRTMSTTEHISVLLIDECDETECIEVAYSIEKLKSLNILLEFRADSIGEKEKNHINKIIKNKKFVDPKSYILYIVTLTQLGYLFLKFINEEGIQNNE